MKIIFLGTGSMVPTKTRNHTAIFLSYKDEGILIDCGEGTQRQFRTAKISPTKITKILITHWHGDHVFGLPGLIQTLGASNYTKTLEVYGPKGSKEYFKYIYAAFIPRVNIKLKINEIKEGKFFENENFVLEAKNLKHGINCYAYAFVEKDKRRVDVKYVSEFGLKKHPILKKLQKGKDITWKGKKIRASKGTYIKKGKKIAFVLDTLFCENAVEIAKNSDILICESTHLSNLKNESKEYKHLTSKESAEIAKKAKVKELILTHFSQRYNDVSSLKKEASEVFKNVKIAEDFMVVEL